MKSEIINKDSFRPIGNPQGNYDDLIEHYHAMNPKTILLKHSKKRQISLMWVLATEVLSYLIIG